MADNGEPQSTDKDLGNQDPPSDGGVAIPAVTQRRLGADNAAVYEEWLGIDATELARLRSAGIV